MNAKREAQIRKTNEKTTPSGAINLDSALVAALFEACGQGGSRWRVDKVVKRGNAELVVSGSGFAP